MLRATHHSDHASAGGEARVSARGGRIGSAAHERDAAAREGDTERGGGLLSFKCKYRLQCTR